MTQRLLHFALGPVQGFIADARRTRDLWAGSFLLSWLSGQAMAALVKASGSKDSTIIFPKIAGDALFDAIRAHRAGNTTKNAPQIGSLPNRFKADVTGIDDPAGICDQAIRRAWQNLADAVWEQFIAGDVEGLGRDTRIIWDRQVGRFWDIAWVVGEDPGDRSDGQWLDQRKNWRSHYDGKAGDERGDLCRLMGRFQEISGYYRIGEREKQIAFYDAVRERKYWHPSSSERRRLLSLNLGTDERLCAIALIKRLFPLLDDIENVIGWRYGENSFNVINWPSVSYIAAVPWLKAVATDSDGKQKDKYAKTVHGALESDFLGETETKLFGLPDHRFFQLDGHLYFEDGIRAWKQDEFKGAGPAEKERNRTALFKGFKEPCDHIGGRASEFYAILLMDGDRIGALIGEYPDIAKDGLARFTEAVRTYFAPAPLGTNPSNGVLVYAGGDDVLALLPLDTAIEAARQLRKAYTAAFTEVIEKSASGKATAADFTMSAAIVFAQYKIPLRAVLNKAHHYLEAIAKDRNGRDSVAIAVMKPGGVAFDWVSCWRKTVDPVAVLEAVAKNRADYSSSFFYNVKERYTPLFNVDGETTSERDIDQVFAEPDFMRAILTAELKKQPEKSKLDKATVEQAIDPLMVIGKPLNRLRDDPIESHLYHFDSALVARFLSVEGRWDLLPKAAGGGETDE